jgi:branched-chain amino acid transport system substrate-binding protein
LQSGLKGQIPLYTAFTIDEITLPRQKDAAVGIPGAQEWVNDLANEQNKRFVSDYRKKHPGLSPTFYGAQTYDAAMLINSAVVATKGNLSDCARLWKRPTSTPCAASLGSATIIFRFRTSTCRKR